MFYSDLVRKACAIMFEAHKGDADKGGYPYVFHPFFLAAQMEDEETVCAALLHDVIEDHPELYSFKSLAEAGFPDPVIAAVRLLTHRTGVPYPDYIKEISHDRIAAAVKLADLRHNLDTSRTGGRKSAKYEQYLAAKQFLERQCP